MPSITSWSQLHSRCYVEDANASLPEPVRDPAWMLARQWQMAEFRGHDGGSPVQARIRMERAPLTRFCAGDPPYTAAASVAYDMAAMPLESMVEREPVRHGPAAPYLAVRAGTRLVGMLRDAHLDGYIGALLTAFPPAAIVSSGAVAALHDDDRLLLAAIRARVPDGDAAYVALSADPLAAFATAAAADKASLQSVVRAWCAWYATSYCEPGQGARSAWNDERPEYRFATSARFSDGEVVLAAPAFGGAALDWHHFDVVAGSLGAQQSSVATVQTVIPSPVGFRGMPPTHTWQLEDGSINYGAVVAGPTDLPRLLVLDFALIYGNDWFIIPIELGVGAITRVRSLVITTTFGDQILVRAAQDVATPGAPWHAFSPAGNKALLVVPPTAVQRLRGPALERVQLVRDDGADVAWAIEHTVETAAGKPRQEDRPPLPEAPRRAGSYRLASSVPPNWVPLVRVATDKGVRLVRGTVLPPVEGDETTVRGVLLHPETSFSLFDEEVPREGAVLTRGYRHARWFGGKSVVWLARTKSVGRGEGASHLEYDVIQDAVDPPPG